MKSPARRRYDVVRCSVVGRVHYGLLIESADGERGYVDSADITDQPGEPWPEIGQQLPCVVLGYTKEGRLRAAARPLYVEIVATADDRVAAVEWYATMRQNGGSPGARGTE
jgi:hypothetical protein